MTGGLRAGGAHEVTIETLGSQGDGIAWIAGERVFVEAALPGDRVEIRLGRRRGDGHAAQVTGWLGKSAHATQPCAHFGRCGGCRLQHLPPDPYAEFKRAEVASALARRGLEPAIGPLMATPPGSRRRLRLAFVRDGARARLGLRPRSRHGVVDLATCPLARPELVALFDPLRSLLRGLDAIRTGEVALTLTSEGSDLLLVTPDPPDLATRERLAGFAAEADVARICWTDGWVEPEPILIRRPPQVRFGGIPVDLPPGTFLQASAEAEAAIQSEVVETLGEARAVADLFAGAGTFALPLAAAGRSVLAVEQDRPAVAAIIHAARRAGLAERVSTLVRDLDRQPLQPAELEPFEAVVLDPPRAGARPQVAALVRSQVTRIAYVSCHPGTFARDARILVDGGYRLGRVTPIDAFLWSAEVELVAGFTRIGLIPPRARQASAVGCLGPQRETAP